MTFEEAMEALKRGHRVRRKDWKPGEYLVVLNPESSEPLLLRIHHLSRAIDEASASVKKAEWQEVLLP